MITFLPFSELQRSADALGGDRADAAGFVPGRRHEWRRIQRTAPLTVSTLVVSSLWVPTIRILETPSKNPPLTTI